MGTDSASPRQMMSVLRAASGALDLDRVAETLAFGRRRLDSWLALDRRALIAVLLGADWPRALLAFPLTLALFLFQATPLLGSVFIYLGAPYWSIAMLNLGFAGLIAEPFLRPISRGWSAVGAAWFVGYFAVAAYGNFALHALAVDTAADNARQSLRFDPAWETLMLVDDGSPMVVSPAKLLEDYDLPVVYVEKRAGAHGDRPLVLAYRLGAPELCARMRGSPVLLPLGAAQRVNAAMACLFELTETPAPPTVMVRQSRGDLGRLGMRGHFDRIEIASGSQTRQLVTAEAAPLLLAPAPRIGCGFERGSDACGASFLTGVVEKLGLGSARDETELLARALDLSPGPGPFSSETVIASGRARN